MTRMAIGKSSSENGKILDEQRSKYNNKFRKGTTCDNLLPLIFKEVSSKIALSRGKKRMNVNRILWL